MRGPQYRLRYRAMNLVAARGKLGNGHTERVDFPLDFNDLWGSFSLFYFFPVDNLFFRGLLQQFGSWASVLSFASPLVKVS